MKKISNQTFDQERSLYGIKDTIVSECVFAGPADGESALKETRNIKVDNCKFSLRYPLWHCETFSVSETVMDELTRAPIWYAKDGNIKSSKINGVKAVRESNNILIEDCSINSTEFGWKSVGITLLNSQITSEYLFFDSKKIVLKNVKMSGKYSFQYVDDLLIENCVLDTKDAFWHSKNVVVKDSVIKGEYLGWYSENVTLIDCTIIGTQPLCYCKNLKLINCKTEKCDLSFEYSDVEATLIGRIESVKNIKSGKVIVDEIGEIINNDPVYKCNGEVIIR